MDFGDKEIMTFYFKQYITEMIYDTQKAYELLDEEYRNKRFGNYEKFATYVKNNSEDIEKSLLLQYKIETFDEYKEYICKDAYGNCYIFKEIKPMEYTVLLDQYTLDDKIFLKQYSQKEDKGKAQMNLEKFKQMLNRQDYTSAYDVLNKDFKAKYFSTENEFKNYILNNLFEYNSFTYTEIANGNKKYKITTRISDEKDYSKENVVKRFTVELLDDDKFCISFDI